MRIVVLTQWFLPEKADLQLAIVKRLSSAGHEVVVLTGFPNYPAGQLFPGWRQRRALTTRQDGYTLRRVALYPSHDRSAVRRSLNYLSFAASSTVSGWSALRWADAVYVYHPPLTAAVGPWLSRRLGGAPYVLHVQDLWPDAVMATGLVGGRAGTGVARVLDVACRAVYERAAAVIAIAPTMAQVLERRGVDQAKISRVCNWADEDLFHPVPRSAAAQRELGLEGRFSVMFAGNVGDVQGLDIAVRAAGQLQDLLDFRLVVVGSGVALPALKALASQLRLRNVLFVPSQPQSRMNELTSAADVQLVSLKDRPFLRAAIPSKIAAVLASGLPMICTAPGDAADLVRESGAGWIAEPEDVDSLANAIRAAHASTPEHRAVMGRRGRRYYEQHLSREVSLRELERIIAGAAESGPHTSR